ncbi:MAG: DUF2510 domain-containing protein [Actinomycetota bacterium]|nr:DUF2510 domain-containing protein [Actinomycetota bacterium]
MQPFSSSPGTAAGWYPDPTRQFEYRWFNGERWTADVSTHGQRFVDPRWLSGAPLPPHVGQPEQRRGAAVASFVLGLSAVATAWLPFLFVLGAVAAIVGFVFGVIALRRVRQGAAEGRTFAIWGLVLSVGAAGLCVVGVLFTMTVLDEVDQLFNPGPYTTSIDRCTNDGGLAVADGTITNDDDTYHDYSIFIRFTDSGRTLDTDVVDVRRVPPHEVAQFHATVFVDSSATVTCTVADVQGAGV